MWVPPWTVVALGSLVSAADPVLSAPSEPLAADPVPLALTISGGATLGIHEAGYLFVLTEALARTADGPELVLATGASAGSGNTLLAVLGACGPRRDAPGSDVGFRTWVDNGLADILVPPDSSVALFSQQAMLDQARVLKAAWQQGLSSDCDVTIAIPVTRLQAVSVPVGDGLSLPRQTVRFIVRVEGQGPGRPPRLSNVADPTSHRLPLSGDVDADVERLWRVIVASAAFPGAFAPVELGFCGPAVTDCVTPTESAAFIDGGVFDNVPLRTAHRLTRDRPETRHVYLDPAIRSYPEHAPSPDTLHELDLGFYVQSFADGFVSQARAQEVYALAENDPEVFGRVFVSTARFPQAGAHLENFFGLFERAFRVFDYTLGMVDAWMELDETVGGDDPHAALRPLLDAPEWDTFQCARGWLADDPELRARCDPAADPDFHALLSVAVGRAWTACQGLSVAHPATRDHAVCRAAAAGASPPDMLPGRLDPPDLLVRTDESDLDHTLRVLAAAGFPFRDLGLPPGGGPPGARGDGRPARGRRRCARAGAGVLRPVAARGGRGPASAGIGARGAHRSPSLLPDERHGRRARWERAGPAGAALAAGARRAAGRWLGVGGHPRRGGVLTESLGGLGARSHPAPGWSGGPGARGAGGPPARHARWLRRRPVPGVRRPTTV